MTYKNPSVTTYDPRIIPLDPPGRRPAWLRAVDDYEPVKLLGANKLPVIDPDTGKGALGWYAAGAPWSMACFIQVETGHPYLVAPVVVPSAPAAPSVDVEAVRADAYYAGWNNAIATVTDFVAKLKVNKP